ncbi:hypothetical protein [Streptomyces sp. SID10815]|uniref:hypothetical protein n=1 Tax=Streptomyces sp. SID10815 TaxID=2706027 RepID=UPI0013C95C5B|nr:hypothetical protein [Streptomyces sp. SID10815]NEA52374.1 hypothetical protein [Streptomyces sp. SID10815]
MTPADELRAAAATLRRLAAAASDHSGSPQWTATRHFPDQPDASYTSLWADRRPLLAGGGGRGRPPAYVHAPVGDYIAAMHPGVGAKLAKWLETEAVTWAGDEVHNGCAPETCTSEAALAVARAILGGAS